MGEVILISSGRGGVGKSTMGKYVASTLAADGHKTLILEMDMGFRCMDIFFGVSEQVVYDVKDILEGHCTTEQCIIECKKNLNLIPASMDCEFLCTEQSLIGLITALKEEYRYIVMDTGAGFTIWHRILAPLASSALLVTSPFMSAVRGTSQVGYQLKKAGLESQRLVINFVPKLPTKEHMSDLDQVIDLVGAQLIGTVPFVPTGDRRSERISHTTFSNIAKRLQGEHIPLIIF